MDNDSVLMCDCSNDVWEMTRIPLGREYAENVSKVHSPTQAAVFV